VWKRNRNLHTIALLDNVINNKFDDPYNKLAQDSPIPLISKTKVKSKLSKNFEQIIVFNIESKTKFENFVKYVNQNQINLGLKPNEKFLMSKYEINNQRPNVKKEKLILFFNKALKRPQIDKEKEKLKEKENKLNMMAEIEALKDMIIQVQFQMKVSL